VFAGFGARLADLTLLSAEAMIRDRPLARSLDQTRRADITDRKGRLLATDYPKTSVFADPKEVIDPADAAAKLATVLPEIDAAKLERQLESKRRFVWVERHITDEQQRRIMHLGLPGIRFRTEYHRIYPQRELTSHVVGYVGVENQALGGIERSFEQRLTAEGLFQGPLALTLDLGVQEIVHSELSQAVKRFQAKGGSGLVMDAGTGGLLAAVSLPDFDPNRYQKAEPKARFNRNTQGTYELGSLFKILTAAMTLDSGTATITERFDARKPLRMARHKIDDFHAKYRELSFAEVIAFSSNIGAARMALDLGTEGQHAYFNKLGLLDRHPIRLPEVGRPQVPERWREINTATAAYGHGIAVSPLQTIDAVAAALCGGERTPAHLVAEDMDVARRPAAVSAETAAIIRWLMLLVVAQGTGSNAQVGG
jgi:cell division protein FtsI (penicillin-binding protein 3)